MNKEIILKLLEKKELSALKSILETVNPVDLAILLETLDDKDLLIIFRVLAKKEAAETFSHMNASMQHTLIETFTDK